MAQLDSTFNKESFVKVIGLALLYSVCSRYQNKFAIVIGFFSMVALYWYVFCEILWHVLGIVYSYKEGNQDKYKEK